ncbi:MAG TPA: SRPBCC domain-containing protein [Myxococcaceae bacterium]|nr:SRPBCC domain-containing protein [Myxococcaceae bacterium]
MSADDPPKPPRTIELTIDLPTDPDTVWRLLTDPAGLAEWFAPQVEGSGAPGGTLTLSWGSEMSWNTQVAAAERGRLLRWKDDFAAYQQLPGTPAPVVIEWHLSPGPGGTRLRLVHSGFGDGADWDDMFDGTQAGWTFFLWHLQQTVRHHLGQRRTVVFERRASVLTRTALGARLFGPEGLALTPTSPSSGSTAQLSLGGTRRRFEVQHARLPTNFFGKVPDLGGAVLLVEMEPGRTGLVQTGLWLSTWGLDAGALESVRAGLHSLADAVFGPRPA